jgi:hypothetical protein
VSDETTTERQVSPEVLATREFTKAKARLRKAETAAQKVVDVQQELIAAREGYALASKRLRELL